MACRAGKICLNARSPLAPKNTSASEVVANKVSQPAAGEFFKSGTRPAGPLVTEGGD
jgi:hypothetical protein